MTNTNEAVKRVFAFLRDHDGSAIFPQIPEMTAPNGPLQHHFHVHVLRPDDIYAVLFAFTARDREIERLRKALEFYADEGGEEHVCPTDGPYNGPWGTNSDDYGKVAKQALKGGA
ncbi:MAG: hypothetical protein Unbinned664contig1000_25 [Prokaryotic dsDNA virus sp.]|nr:MAG: hypothetical protein Unbinned664contig1000_25 [Prokaryotic dsDNA virus sp.]|tara:strand:- start:20354 stop:20698 length:345 start_codon:yes stop_codon:yes gene_type:complete